MPTTIAVTVHGHPVNRWFLRAFARPVVMIDGIDHPALWARPHRVPVTAGVHTVVVDVRYRGTRRLRSNAVRVAIAADETRRLAARNGPLKLQAFRLKEFSMARPLRYSDPD